MTHVVTSGCVDHKYQECVAVCPVDAFREADTYLVIDPDECIDCGACEPECPTTAIFAEEDLPEKWEAYTEINARLSPLWPVIAEKIDALPEADEFKDIEDKRDQLDETPGP